MDDKFLNWIYETHFSKTGNSFDQFKNDMSDLGFRKWVHGKYFSDKSSLDQFESDLGINTTQPQAQINQPEDEDTDFEKSVDKIPLIGGVLKRASKAIRSGSQQGEQLSEGINALAKGVNLNEEELQELSTAVIKNRKQILDENSYTAKFGRGELKGFKDYAGFIGETIAQSGSMMIRGALDAFTDSKTLGGLTALAGAGAAAGSAIPVGGSVAGAFATSMGGVSGMIEASSVFFESLNEELLNRGFEPNSNTIKEIVSDEEWLNKTRDKAVKKGAVVGGVDTLAGLVTGGIGSKVTRSASNLTKLKAAGKAFGVELAGGSAGEALSQVAVEGKVYDWKAVQAEALGELLPGPVPALIGYARNSRKEAKANKNLADATGSSITKEEKEESEKPLSTPDGIDAVEAGDNATANQAAADVVLRHSPEELAQMTEVYSKSEGTSKEVIDKWHSKLEEALKVSQSFNTPELEANPEAKSRAVAVRMNTNEIKAQRDALEEKMNLADETLRPQYEEQLKELDTLIEDNNQIISSIITRKETEISDDPIYYGNKALELETNLANDKKQLSEKERALFDIGKKMEKTLLDASRDDEFFQNSKNSLITHFDENPLSEGSNNVSLKKEVKHIGDFFSKKPPKRFLERLGEGDIILGETLFGQGKALYDEIKTIQSKLNPNFLRTSKLAIEENRRRQKSILDKQRDQLFEDQKIDGVTDGANEGAIDGLNQPSQVQADITDTETIESLQKAPEIGTDIKNSLPEIQELETKKETEITQALKPNFGKKDEIPSVLTNKEIEKVVKSDSVSPSEVRSVGEALESKREELTKQLQELKSLRDCIWG